MLLPFSAARFGRLIWVFPHPLFHLRMGSNSQQRRSTVNIPSDEGRESCGIVVIQGVVLHSAESTTSLFWQRLVFAKDWVAGMLSPFRRWQRKLKRYVKPW